MSLISEKNVRSDTAGPALNGELQKDHETNGQAEAHTGTGEAAMASFRVLTTEYHTIAARNAARLSSMTLEFTHAKTPVDLIALQQKVIAETFQTAIADSSQITKLTTAMFSAALPTMLRHFGSPEQIAKG